MAGPVPDFIHLSKPCTSSRFNRRREMDAGAMVGSNGKLELARIDKDLGVKLKAFRLASGLSQMACLRVLSE